MVVLPSVCSDTPKHVQDDERHAITDTRTRVHDEEDDAYCMGAFKASTTKSHRLSFAEPLFRHYGLNHDHHRRKNMKKIQHAPSTTTTTKDDTEHPKYSTHFSSSSSSSSSSGYTTGSVEQSGKMSLLLSILQLSRDVGDRVSVFSQSLSTLNVIEHMLHRHNDYYTNIHRKGCEKKKCIHFVRIDGSTPQSLRFERIAMFNDPTADVNVILISTRAGGEGVNLCGGNRVVIFDVCWNPCHDAQSMCRYVRRIGTDT